MKLKHSLFTAVAAVAMAFSSLAPQSVIAAFNEDADIDNKSDFKKDFYTEQFGDGTARAFWVLKLGNAIYTLALFPSGGWAIDQYDDNQLHTDGSMTIYWEKDNGGGSRSFAVWRISPTGQLIGAATYTVSGWNPVFTDEGAVLDGNVLVRFDGEGGNAGLQAAWLLNAAGAILKTFLWQVAPAGGWSLDQGPVGTETNFMIIYVNDGARLLTYYVFDTNGNWINARTYSY